MPLFSSPLSPGYWKEAKAAFRSPRSLAFAALMTAAAAALSLTGVPLADHLRINLTFLARALCMLVCGPVMAIVYGAAEELLCFLLHPVGPFFIGDLLSAAAACLIYALFFYRARVTLFRIFLAKAMTDYTVNVFLGSYWSILLYGRGYLDYAVPAFLKNTLYLPAQVLLLAAVFQLLLPVLARWKLIPSALAEAERIPRFSRRGTPSFLP